MLAKDPAFRPSAAHVYDALAPWCSRGGDPVLERDPTRPFRRPLLATSPRATPPDEPSGPRLTEDEVDALRAQVEHLLLDGRPHEAVNLVESAVGDDDLAALRLRHLHGTTLFVAGEFRRAAPVLVEAGRAYRRYLGPANPLSLDCDHDAGLAWAEVGDHARALPQLRRFVDLAPSDDERILEARMAHAAMSAAAGDLGGARAALTEVRARLVDRHGEHAIPVRAVDRQRARWDRQSEPAAGDPIS